MSNLSGWTAIAARERHSEGNKHLWVELPDAPLGLREAMQLHERGELLKAISYSADGITEYVVIRHPVGVAA